MSTKYIWKPVPPKFSDTFPPVMTLNGIHPVAVLVGSSYADAGASAEDLYASTLTGSLVTTGTVDT
ncbi:MAG: hypothetical protein HQ523_05925 [Lentisphaerae bacterium]|nr:hypothetical protein [Lentisphaerota bacterium]